MQGLGELEDDLVEDRPEPRGRLLEDPQRRLVRRPGRRVEEGEGGQWRVQEGRPERVQSGASSGWKTATEATCTLNLT